MDKAEEKRMWAEFSDLSTKLATKAIGGMRVGMPSLEAREIFKYAWKAALAHQDKMIMAAYADAAEVCVETQILTGKPWLLERPDDAYATLELASDNIKARTPDDARRKFEEMKK